METIIYQGQSISVERVDEINTAVGEGSDTIYRDEQGIYYLERDRTGFEQDEDSSAREDFYSLHRINITAAVLWGIASSDRFNTLRMEAADWLMETRGGIDDSWPSSYVKIKEARGKQSAAKWVKKVMAGTALSAPAKRRALNEARAAIGEPPLVPATSVTIHLTSKQSGEEWDTLEMPRTIFDEIERRAKERGQDFATCFTEMVENFIRSNPEPLIDTEETDDVEEGEDGAVEEANLPERQFSFTFKPTRKTIGYSVQVEVHPESMGAVAKLADVFGLTPRAFLRRHVNGTLPGQPRKHHQAVELLADVMLAEDIAFTCLDESMATRIKRAAQARELTEDAFIADSVGRDVDAFEECMIVHPQTGQLLCDDHGTLYREFNWKELAPPIGRENDPQFQASGGTNAMMGHPKYIEAKLDPFHGDLLRTFERRNQIDAETYARAVLEWHLEEMYDLAGNGGEAEINMVLALRDDDYKGRRNLPLMKEEVADRCHAAGLDPADYPDAGQDVDEEEQDDDNAFEMGRRHVADPDDIALLAAAAPEPIGKPPAPPKGKGKRSRKTKGGK